MTTPVPRVEMDRNGALKRVRICAKEVVTGARF